MSPRIVKDAVASLTRPRVEGDREQEILDATIDVLGEVGYDRLTMDAVAARAKASKATLYRRWNGKASLVIDALVSLKDPQEGDYPDTGSLRGDLKEAFCKNNSLVDNKQLEIMGSVITAISRDAEFAAEFRDKFIAPKVARNAAIYARAAERGELRDGVDLEVLGIALPAICLHRLFILGEPPTDDLVARIIDQLIIPAATRG